MVLIFKTSFGFIVYIKVDLVRESLIRKVGSLIISEIIEAMVALDKRALHYNSRYMCRIPIFVLKLMLYSSFKVNRYNRILVLMVIAPLYRLCCAPLFGFRACKRTSVDINEPHLTF